MDGRELMYHYSRLICRDALKVPVELEVLQREDEPLGREMSLDQFSAQSV